MLLNFSQRHMGGLSVLRFALAIYLMVFHTLPQYEGVPVVLQGLASGGYMATSLFFLLSGFVLSHVYLDASAGLRSAAGRFLANRFWMLYPLHLIGLLLSAMILLVQYRATGQVLAVADIPHAVFQGYGQSLHVSLEGLGLLGAFLSHLFLLHAWNPFFLSFNVPSWSISALMCFYLVFVWLGPRLVRSPHPVRVLLLLNGLYLLPPLVLIGLQEFGSTATAFLHTNPLARLPEFLAGVVLCAITRRLPAVQISTGSLVAVVLGVVTGLVLLNTVLLTLGPAGYYLVHNGAALLLQCSLLVLFSGMPEIRAPRIAALVERLANASLSIFVLHLPLFFILTRLEKLLRVWWAGHEGAPLMQQVRDADLSLAWYPVVLVAIVLVSVWCQERIVSRLRQRAMKSPGVAARPTDIVACATKNG